ncbi:MAG TPA: twin-arginine translocase TatA/TatE family subunit [Gaiellaceae bacterium]|jgi:sec-independent protein translocase protein TatA|nr:twin-arginine translocase TatA/TatE family subunit [Gaiellaceae bacterium]
MPFGISIWELMILLIVLLLIFGAKRLPEMGRSLGKGMREFKDSVSGVEETVTAPTPTSTTPAAPAGLPSASSDPLPPAESAPETPERETVT